MNGAQHYAQGRDVSSQSRTLPEPRLRELYRRGMHRITAVHEVEALQERVGKLQVPKGAKNLLSCAVQALLRAPAGWRLQARVRRTFAEQLQVLSNDFPHFGAVIDYIEAMSHLMRRGDRTFHLPPLLFVGTPGVGKTYFVSRLARAFGVPYDEVHMESVTAGFVLAGGSATWSESQPGRVFDLLVQGTHANPIMLLDEIDKVSGGRYNPMGPIYGLLESHTASRFCDEFVGVPIDASHISWVLTANDLAFVPWPIRSRTEVFHIPDPYPSQRVAIVKSIYRDLLQTARWGSGFKRSLDEKAARRLAETGVSSRDLRHALVLACARAAARNADSVGTQDVRSPEAMLAASIDLRRVRPMGSA